MSSVIPWKRLIRFIPSSVPSSVLIGEPLDASLDIGVASYEKKEIKVSVFSGKSVLDAGEPTGAVETVGKILSPLAEHEVGTIRCIGLNYIKHAHEAKMAIPKQPVVFMKPATALADPFPAPSIVPRHTLTAKNTCDYEAEMVIVLGREAKNVTEADALNYVLGYTAANDLSSRDAQMIDSQWSYSKSFDHACPIGPAIVSSQVVGDPSKLHIKGIRNGKVVQDSSLSDLIFSVPKIVSFLSQGTTLPSGTIILTGTPAGVGLGFPDGSGWLQDGDDFRVNLEPGVGTLINKIEFEK